MEPQRLLRLLSGSCKGDETARDELLRFHRPFIFRVASRFAGRPLDERNDDELSIALLAFNEAIGQYEGRREASFLSYAATVIRHRLIDHYRRVRREGPSTVPLEMELEEDLIGCPAEVREAWVRYEAEQEETRTAEEVDLLVAELARFGISLADLVASSPKHRDTRERLLRVARLLLDHPELMEYLRRTRQLPLKDLERISGVSRKVLESGRRYVLAVALVMQHPELERIRTHIRLPRLEEVAFSRE
jgi:RNA polymerase sigma factor